MGHIYISTDIESSGPNTDYSMLSLGQCVVGRSHIRFYRELKPTKLNYELEAIKIGALHLECLPKEAKYDPRHVEFDPVATLGALSDLGTDQKHAMQEAQAWVEAVRGDHPPMMLTDTHPFDGSFVGTYFQRHLGNNPYGHKICNIDMLLKGITLNINAHLKDGLPARADREHHALDDCIYQGALAEPILDRVDAEWRKRLIHLV